MEGAFREYQRKRREQGYELAAEYLRDEITKRTLGLKILDGVNTLPFLAFGSKCDEAIHLLQTCWRPEFIQGTFPITFWFLLVLTKPPTEQAKALFQFLHENPFWKEVVSEMLEITEKLILIESKVGKYVFPMDGSPPIQIFKEFKK